jgi:hypothetical protein
MGSDLLIPADPCDTSAVSPPASGVCAASACLRLFRLFVSDDPADCDGCREKDPREDARLLAANGAKRGTGVR